MRRRVAILSFIAVSCSGRPMTAGEGDALRSAIAKDIGAQRQEIQRVVDKMSQLEGNANANVEQIKKNGEQLEKVSTALTRIVDKLGTVSCSPN